MRSYLPMAYGRSTSVFVGKVGGRGKWKIRPAATVALWICLIALLRLP